jgi:hypothetical protein
MIGMINLKTYAQRLIDKKIITREECEWIFAAPR